MLYLQELFNSFGNVRLSTVLSYLVLILASHLIFQWLWTFKRRYSLACKLPGPKGRFLLGNLPSRPRNAAEFFRLLSDCPSYGKVVRFWFGPVLLVIVTDPLDAKYVLGKLRVNDRPKVLLVATRPFLRDGLVPHQDDDLYKSHRRTVSHNFQPATLRSFQATFEEKARALSARLSDVADGRTINILDYFCVYTTESIYATVVGYDIAKKPAWTERIIHDTLEAEDDSTALLTKPWVTLPVISRLFELGRLRHSYKKFVDGFIASLVEKTGVGNEEGETRRADKDSENKETKAESLLETIRRGIRSKDASLEVLKDEILNVTTAAFLSSSNALSFLMILLGIHQDVQEEVSRELDEVFGSSPRLATTEDLARLHTLDRVIKETLRLFPTVPAVIREIYEDIPLPSGNVVPEGAKMLVYVYQVHRDPKNFPDPDSFIPDRWLPGNATNNNADVYMPFGAGLRPCIGTRYAKLQMKHITCHLLRQFKVTTCRTMQDLTRLEIGITLSFDGFDIEVHKKT